MCGQDRFWASQGMNAVPGAALNPSLPIATRRQGRVGSGGQSCLLRAGLLHREFFEHAEQAVASIVDDHIEVIEADPLALAGVLWSMLHGVAMLLIEQQLRFVTDEPGGVEKAIRLCVQTLYDGVQAIGGLATIRYDELRGMEVLRGL